MSPPALGSTLLSDRVQVVSLVGAESTGKSTLATALGESLPAVVVDETLRRFVVDRGRVPTAAEQLSVIRTQIAREAEAQRKAEAVGCRWVVSDGGALMTAVYSIMYYQDDSLLEVALAHHRSYALTVLCDSDIAWEPDQGQRDSPQARDEAQQVLIDQVAGQEVQLLLASGSVDDRVATVLAALDVRRR